MTSPTLKVTPEVLRSMARRCEALAVTVSPTLPSVTISGWQSTSAATSAVNADMSTTGAACKSRMAASGSKLTQAASAYENRDNHGAQQLGAVGSHLPASSGTDGDAGGMPPALTSLVPGPTGGDGGAAGELGTPRQPQ